MPQKIQASAGNLAEDETVNGFAEYEKGFSLW